MRSILNEPTERSDHKQLGFFPFNAACKYAYESMFQSQTKQSLNFNSSSFLSFLKSYSNITVPATFNVLFFIGNSQFV